MRISADDEILRHIVEKGSVALDGISLTVAYVSNTDFVVSLIPHTVKATNLHTKKDGSLINIENDVIGKYVEKLMKPRENEVAESRITIDFLLKNGF